MNILFVGIDYYEYTARIVEEIRAQGHHVSFHSMELTGRWFKILKRYFPARFGQALRRNHRDILRRESGRHYDKVVFLQVHWMAPETVEAFRREFAGATFILYNWDSLRTHDYRAHVPAFDRVLTFDREDADALGAEYLPLFALPEYVRGARSGSADLDLYFVGTLVSADRLRAVDKLQKFCAANGLRLGSHLYCSPAGMLSFLKKRLWIRGLTTKTISQAEIVAMMRRSRAVFDFPNHRQSGYTMRFIENLCAGLKIVTSNPLVARESFYSPDRFLILDDDLDLSGIPAFLDRPLGPAPDLSQFELSEWTRRLLGERSSEAPLACPPHAGGGSQVHHSLRPATCRGEI